MDGPRGSGVRGEGRGEMAVRVSEREARKCAKRGFHVWEKVVWKATGGYTWTECLRCGLFAYSGNGVGFAFEDGRSVLDW